MSWRSPVFVPVCALVVSLLLTLGLGRFAGGAPAQTPTDGPAPADIEGGGSLPPTPSVMPSVPAPATEPVATGTAFAAATDGRPQFTLVVAPEQAARLGSFHWKVLKRSGNPADQPGFSELNSGMDAPPNRSQQTASPLVDRLLCVQVPATWTVEVPAAAPDVTPASLDSPQIACQGGWADARAVPAMLTFTARPA